MKKPERKCDVLIENYDVERRTIQFYATAELIVDFNKYGHIEWAYVTDEMKTMRVSKLYDFHDVLGYIKSYET